MNLEEEETLHRPTHSEKMDENERLVFQAESGTIALTKTSKATKTEKAFAFMLGLTGNLVAIYGYGTMAKFDSVYPGMYFNFYSIMACAGGVLLLPIVLVFFKAMRFSKQFYISLAITCASLLLCTIIHLMGVTSNVGFWTIILSQFTGSIFSIYILVISVKMVYFFDKNCIEPLCSAFSFGISITTVASFLMSYFQVSTWIFFTVILCFLLIPSASSVWLCHKVSSSEHFKVAEVESEHYVEKTTMGNYWDLTKRIKNDLVPLFLNMTLTYLIVPAVPSELPPSGFKKITWTNGIVVVMNFLCVIGIYIPGSRRMPWFVVFSILFPLGLSIYGMMIFYENDQSFTDYNTIPLLIYSAAAQLVCGFAQSYYFRRVNLKTNNLMCLQIVNYTIYFSFLIAAAVSLVLTLFRGD